MAASPQITAILFFFIRKATPSLSRAGHLARALHDRLGIEADLLGRQAVVLGVLQVVEDLGRAQQRLGGDAAPVEADAAQIVALDDGRLEAELGGADGRDVAAGARADDDDVEALLSHGGALLRAGLRRSETPRGPGDAAGGPVIQANSPPSRKAGDARGRPERSGVAARAQVLVEQRVVAVDVGLVLGRRASCPGSPPRPSPACPCGRAVELLPDRPATLPRRQRRWRPDRRLAVAVGTPSERRHDSRRGQMFQCLDIVRATNASSFRLCVASRYETQCCNVFNRAERHCDNFAAAQGSSATASPCASAPWPRDARQMFAGCACRAQPACTSPCLQRNTADQRSPGC